MFGWLRQRRMIGGVVFGSPGWSPTRIENTFDEGGAGEALNGPAAGEEEAGAAAGAGGGGEENGGSGGFKNQKSKIESPKILPQPFHHLPHSRRDLGLLLEGLQIGRTSATIPSLVEQFRHLGGGGGAGGGAEPRVRAMVLNLLPTQPEFALGSALTRLALEDVRMGVHALHHMLRPRQLLVVVDRHDFAMRRAWKKVARQHLFPMELRPMLNRYPQAHPTILLRTLWGKRLQVDALPSRFNRLVIDPVTAWAFGRYLRTKQALTDRPVQVFLQEAGARGGGGGGARLLSARIGETVAEFCRRYHLEFADKEIILNGMLAGTAGRPEMPIRGDTESISLRPMAAPEVSTPCISCGWCVDVCPTALTPVRLLELNGRIPSGMEMAHGMGGEASGATGAGLLRSSQARESLHCLGCGLCSYVCPTRLPLTQEAVALRLRVVTATGALRHALPPAAAATGTTPPPTITLPPSPTPPPPGAPGRADDSPEAARAGSSMPRGRESA